MRTLGVCGGVRGRQEGVCDSDEMLGCTYQEAVCVRRWCHVDDGMCTFPTRELIVFRTVEGDVTFSLGFVNVSDILLTLSMFKTLCE